MNRGTISRALIAGLCLFAAAAGGARAQNGTSPQVVTSDLVVKNVGIDQKLNQQLPLDTPFVDESGRNVRLGDYFGKRPVVLTIVYYDCPQLCNLTLNGMVKGLKDVPFTTAKEYDVVVISMNPDEKPALADAKKKAYTEAYGRPGAERGWHFLTGTEPNIKKLTDTIGYRYLRIEKPKPQPVEYAHASAIMVATPQGRLARYFYGIEFAPRFLRIAIYDASQGKIADATSKILMFCYQYDPTTKGYSLAIDRLLKVSGVATLLTLGTFVLTMLKRERRQMRTTIAGNANAENRSGIDV